MPSISWIYKGQENCVELEEDRSYTFGRNIATNDVVLPDIDVVDMSHFTIFHSNNTWYMSVNTDYSTRANIAFQNDFLDLEEGQVIILRDELMMLIGFGDDVFELYYSNPDYDVVVIDTKYCLEQCLGKSSEIASLKTIPLMQ